MPEVFCASPVACPVDFNIAELNIHGATGYYPRGQRCWEDFTYESICTVVLPLLLNSSPRSGIAAYIRGPTWLTGTLLIHRVCEYVGEQEVQCKL